MTLVSTVAPLAAYATVFQTVVYLLVPRQRRTLWAPLFTGVVGALLTIGAAALFGLETVGLGMPEPLLVMTWGISTVVVMSLIAGSMLRRPELRAEMADPRLGSLSRGQAFTQIYLRIPIMTALIEEAFFRGVLHAALMALYPPTVALMGGALLFGVWHVGPGFDQAQAAGRTAFDNAVHVAITVAVTAVAGAVLVWLRIETGSIWVPFVVHAGINMTMATFARRAARSTRT